MISQKHNCIFVHQRKCAGVSISRAFGFDDTTVHTPAWCYMNDGVLSPEFHTRPPNYLVFAVVRNPWDRLVSGWQFCEQTRTKTLRHVLEMISSPSWELRSWEYVHVARPQHATLLDRAGCKIARLLRFERLQSDFDQLCDDLGMPRKILERANTTNHLCYREYFQSWADRELFLRCFGRDVDTFEYEF